jgi:hypothetical protein
MELKAGLGGYAVAGHATEIQIQLFSTVAVAVELEVRDSNGFTTLPLQLEEQMSRTVWLAVTPQHNEPINVRLRGGPGERIEKQLTFKHSPARLTLISSSIPVRESFSWHQPSGGITPVVLAAGSLPHTTQTYAGIDAIVTDLQSLSDLSQDQYDSLGYFLGRCGIMLISGADERLLGRLHKSSGCSGRFIHSVDTLSQVTPRLLELNAGRPPKPPAPRDLLSLQETAPQPNIDVTLPLYLGGYVLFMTLVTWSMKKAQYPLLLPAFVAGAGILVWSGMGSHRLITWAETESDDSHARVSRLLLLGGDRRGKSQYLLDADTNLLNFNADTQHSSIHYPSDGNRRALNVHTALLSPQGYQLISVARHSPRFLLFISDGSPEVVFVGKTPPGETRLMWHGKSYDVPVLSQNERWRPNENLGHPPTSPAERLLNKRLSFNDPALLVPITPDSASNVTSTVSWLVIRHDRGQVL